MKDVRTGALTLVSVGLDGAPSNGASGDPSLSDNGQTIAFTSNATNLVAGGPTDGSENVYVAQLTPNANGQGFTVSGNTLVSTGNGQHGIGDTSAGVSGPALSGDGQHVAFASNQALMSGVLPGYNIYEVDLQTGVLKLISAGADGTGGASSGDFTDADSVDPTLSFDGSRVAYESLATNLAGSGLSRTLRGLTSTTRPATRRRHFMAPISSGSAPPPATSASMISAR